MPDNVKCSKCNDTGINETGNNDLPCNCPAGDTAMFHISGIGVISGATVKKILAKRKGDSSEPAKLQPK